MYAFAADQRSAANHRMDDFRNLLCLVLPYSPVTVSVTGATSAAVEGL